MASIEFSRTLKKLRTKAGYSQKQVYEYFNIPQSTFSSWEVGKSEPSGDMLIKLCEFYKCDMMKEFSSIANEVLFTNAELKVIDKYRELDRAGKDEIEHVLIKETQRVQMLKQKSTRIMELESALNKCPSVLHLYTYMNKIACAGVGFYFEDIPSDTIEAPYVEDADFIIGVSGDSMEPDYYDGDKLYVRKANEISTGKIGIFLNGNECFIKELGIDGLISHNKKYDNIPASEDIRVIGEVLGRVGES